MMPKWPKLAILVWPRKYVHSSFSSLVYYSLPKDILLRNFEYPQHMFSLRNKKNII